MESKYTNKYEVACAILDKLEQGGSGGGKFVLVDGTKFEGSTFSTVPEYYDFSEITDFSYMFSDCDNLTSIPQLNTSNNTNFKRMFSYCTKLTSAPQLDTANGTNFEYMFYECRNLNTVPPINVSNATYSTNLDDMFNHCTALENISFVGSINEHISFNYSSLLTYDSIKSILTACSNTTSTSAKTLKFNRTIADNNGELATLIGDCTTKGWTITGLTLE